MDDKGISTEYSALMNTVMADDPHAARLPINEPAREQCAGDAMAG